MFLLLFFGQAELSSRDSSSSPRWLVGLRHMKATGKKNIFKNSSGCFHLVFPHPLAEEKKNPLVTLVRRKCFSNASTVLLTTKKKKCSWKRAADPVSLYPINFKVLDSDLASVAPKKQNKIKALPYFKSPPIWKVLAGWEEGEMDFRRALSASELISLLIFKVKQLFLGSSCTQSWICWNICKTPSLWGAILLWLGVTSVSPPLVKPTAMLGLV